MCHLIKYFKNPKIIEKIKNPDSEFLFRWFFSSKLKVSKRNFKISIETFLAFNLEASTILPKHSYHDLYNSPNKTLSQVFEWITAVGTFVSWNYLLSFLTKIIVCNLLLHEARILWESLFFLYIVISYFIISLHRIAVT